MKIQLFEEFFHLGQAFSTCLRSGNSCRSDYIVSDEERRTHRVVERQAGIVTRYDDVCVSSYRSLIRVRDTDNFHIWNLAFDSFYQADGTARIARQTDGYYQIIGSNTN